MIIDIELLNVYIKFRWDEADQQKTTKQITENLYISHIAQFRSWVKHYVSTNKFHKGYDSKPVS